MKILIAEDEPLTRLVLQKALEGAGHEVITAGDGLEAFEKYCVSGARVVVSDWEMPEMSGLELCQIIRERPSVEYTYFIMLTAVHCSSQEYQTAMTVGVDDFLTKPVEADTLHIRLRVAERILKFANQVRQLESLLPICSYCKKIRDDENQWQQLEVYLHEHTGTQFSHGICPQCMETVKAEMTRFKK